MKKKKFGLFAGKKSGARRREKVTKFKDYRDSYYENDDFDEDFEDDYDSDDYDRDYAEDDDYYRDDYDDVDRDYENDARYDDERDYRDDDRYDDDEDGDYRDDTDADYRDDDDADYRDDERYSDEDDENYSDEDVEEERYEDDADSEDERYSDDEDYRDEDDRYADEDDARYDDEEGDRYEDDEDYRDEDDRYADEDDTRYDEEDDRYADEEEDRYADDVDYREDARYADEEDENYADEDYRDDYYEDDYDYERYDDDDRYASASARRNKGGAFVGKSSKSKRLKSSKKSAKNSRKNSKKNKKNRDDNDTIFARFLTFVKGTSAVERTAAAVGIVILAGVIVTVSFFSTALHRNKELNSFADVGSNMDDTQVIGQSGLIAVADAEKARSLTAEMVDEEDDDEAAEPETESAKINMSLTTIKSDMKIKFFNAKTNKLVASVPFKVDVVTPDGSKTTFEDDDKDGIIYKKELKAGKYTVTPVALTDEYSDYELDTSSKTLTVKDTVEMKAVDVSNEIKKESQVNAAKEDTAVQTQVESVLKDTVEWVESTKTPIGDGEGDGGDYTYEEIDNNSIKNPISYGRSFAPGTFVKTALFTVDPAPLDSNENNGDASDIASTEKTVDKDDENKGDTPSNENQGDNNGGSSNPGNGSDNSGSNGNGGTGEGGNSNGGSQNGDGNTGSDTQNGGGNAGSGSQNQNNGGSNNNPSQGGNSGGNSNQQPEPPKEDKNMRVNGSGDNPYTIQLKAGETKEIKITDTNGNSISVNSTSSDSSVATLEGNTIKTFKGKTGKPTIILKRDGYKEQKIVVDVKARGLWVEPTNVAMTVDEKKNVYVKDEDGTLLNGVSFSSNNPNVAKVDENKNIIALNEGTATITATCNGYNQSGITVTVKRAADKKMKLNIENGIKLKVGDTTNAITAVDAADGKTPVKIKSIAYSSDEDKKMLEIVDGNKVRAKAKGSGKAFVNITADGYTTYTLTIYIEGTGGKIPLKISKMTLMEGKKVSPAASELVKDDNIKKIKLTSDNPNVAKIEGDSSIVPVAKGEANITVTADGYEPSDKIKVTVLAKKDPLTDKDGNPLYMKNSDGKFVEATLADYDPNKKFYTRKNGKQEYKYTGWQTIDGKTYFFKKDHEYVTGEQVIQGAKYTFGADGVLSSGSGSRGIDVSKWNGSIDWKKVKNEGIDFAIIRCGYRGSSAGALIEDPTFRANMKGAQAAGIKVGVYFFTQAVNEVEAVEEASMVINLCKGYGLSYPVYLDVEGSNGRGDGISAAQRTANIKAFCGTIQNAGYKAGVYANKTWFTSKINTSQLTNYKIWLAQYAASPTYNATRYDMWQYTSKGKVSGISGNVDMNTWYR